MHSAAYVPLIAFIWVSAEADLLSGATRQLLNRSELPLCRFVDDGCGMNRIEAYPPAPAVNRGVSSGWQENDCDRSGRSSS